MSKVIYDGQSFECGEQSVLECLTAQGIAIPSSCHSGLCQTCVMRVVQGSVPDRAKAGLKSTLTAQNYFLACSCYPQQDIEVMLPDRNMGKIAAQVVSKTALNADILHIQLQATRPLNYRAGQFINVFKDDVTTRCYSLASVPELDATLNLHVRQVPNGLVSGWVFAQLKVGDTLNISEAAGDCFYVTGNPTQDILLIGTGSGLAPLYGIIRDALCHGHQGQIRLYHGSYHAEGLYLIHALRTLAKNHANFHYTPCVSDGESDPSFAQGMVLDVALKDTPNLSGWRVFLCGNPDMVKAAQQQTFFAGASLSNIFADPF